MSDLKSLPGTRRRQRKARASAMRCAVLAVHGWPWVQLWAGSWILTAYHENMPASRNSTNRLLITDLNSTNGYLRQSPAYRGAHAGSGRRHHSFLPTTNSRFSIVNPAGPPCLTLKPLSGEPAETPLSASLPCQPDSRFRPLNFSRCSMMSRSPACVRSLQRQAVHRWPTACGRAVPIQDWPLIRPRYTAWLKIWVRKSGSPRWPGGICLELADKAGMQSNLILQVHPVECEEIDLLVDEWLELAERFRHLALVLRTAAGCFHSRRGCQ